MVDMYLHLYIKIHKKGLKCRDIMNIHLTIGKIVHSKDNWKSVLYLILLNKPNSKLSEVYSSKNHKISKLIIIIIIIAIMIMTMIIIMMNYESQYLIAFINSLLLLFIILYKYLFSIIIYKCLIIKTICLLIYYCLNNYILLLNFLHSNKIIGI